MSHLKILIFDQTIKRLVLYTSVLVATRCCMYRLQRKINQKQNYRILLHYLNSIELLWARGQNGGVHGIAQI